jgi:TPR repeat protein
MYMRGQGVAQDYDRAGVLFLQAAVQDCAKAQYNLGVMYDESLGMPLNYSKSVQWKNRAFRNGFVKGRHDLGPLGLVRTRASYYLDGDRD